MNLTAEKEKVMQMKVITESSKPWMAGHMCAWWLVSPHSRLIAQEAGRMWMALLCEHCWFTLWALTVSQHDKRLETTNVTYAENLTLPVNLTRWEFHVITVFWTRYSNDGEIALYKKKYSFERLKLTGIWLLFLIVTNNAWCTRTDGAHELKLSIKIK